ncbi:lipoprotein [Staphylococcus piscifermentans]|uniref:Uncharacterized protein n=1 Tax=Staphylococcus piscifermentans TaxID=70258 RepID=A0A239TIL4_9STAP|nr:hypothetical protein [Staphylococcus piscifermentans]RTX85233.1 hypothetical protein CD139_04320 [Staphylococcus piscifermentans]GEP85722.1 hypothetical protein SPI02_23070 [Staphylococcus piscifermentans]SNU97279.1 lipoprotein [Staphylococcus piscifermentans]
MKFRYLGAGLLASTLLLTACGQGDKSEDTKSESKSDSGSKSDGSGFSNSSKKEDNSSNSSSESKSENHSDSDSEKENSKSSSSENEDTNSPQYLAKVWAAALPAYRDTGRGQFDDMKITHYDVSGNVLNPYNADNSIKFPEGTQMLSGSPTAAGLVTYSNNGDGTINVYNVPSHFHDPRWLESNSFSQSESERIMNNPKVVKLYDGNQSALDAIASKIEEGGHNSQDIVYHNSEESQADRGDSDSSSDDSSSDDSSSSEEVTRENVIDKVEEYEGHNLDTSKYTYKEPEQKGDGSWGFSFDDKEGNLAGSYIVDPDGHVTEYDADGNEV